MDLRDLFTGELHPALVLALIERLPLSSAYAAQCQDHENWREYVDLDHTYYALAGIYDAVNLNTTATGNFKRRPKIDPWPTPQVAIKARKKKPKNVAELYALFGGARESR